MAANAEFAPIASADPIEIRTLMLDDIQDLRLGWRTRLHPDEIRRIVETYPGRSVWAPESLEFAIAAPWRHRPEITNIQELSAVRHPDQLVEAVVERARLGGAALVLAIELDETRRPIFYDRVSFSLLEEVITYELVPPQLQDIAASRLQFHRIDLANPAMLDLLCNLDHSAFPWVWWNSRLEFEAYGITPGVEVFVGYDDKSPVSYVGMTSYPGWGHLDRIAVAPERQRTGLGLDSLEFAVRTLTQRGARRIGLSTQRLNLRSQQLYEQYGFRRSATNDYRLFGRYLVEPDALNSMSIRP